MRYYKIKNKKNIISIVFLLVVTLGLIFVFTYFSFKKNDSGSKEQSKKNQQTEKKETIESETNKQNNNSNNDSEEPKYSPAKEPTAVVRPGTEISTSIDSFTQSSDAVNIQASVNGLDSGSCQFKFSAEDGSTLFKTADITQKKCNLSISPLEFVYIGKWSAINTVNGVSSSPREANIQ
jgi:cytoskeletal protein RodZ